MSNRTPGKWRIRIGNSQMCDPGTTVWHRDCIGVYSDAESHGDAEADAWLIVSAPEMLEALVITRGNVASLGPAGALAECYTPYREWLKMLDDVIAKARGENYEQKP